MPTPTTFTYNLSTDFPGGQINSTSLEIAIQASSIVTALNGISTSGNTVQITFADVLSAGDKTTLDGNQSNPAGGLIASTPTAPFIDNTARYGILAYAKNLNLNSTADQVIIVTTNRYMIRRITVGKVSAPPVLLSAGGIYTAKAKAGTALVPAAQLYTGLSALLSYVDLALNVVTTNKVQTTQLLYFSLTTPMGSACTTDLAIWGDDYVGLV